MSQTEAVLAVKVVLNISFKSLPAILTKWLLDAGELVRARGANGAAASQGFLAQLTESWVEEIEHSVDHSVRSSFGR
jgi:hypothetical protein